MSREKLGCIVLCRMGSKRLPGKTLAHVGDRPLLWYLVSRLRGIQAFDGTPIIATSTRDIDQPIVDWAASEGLQVFRGAQEDVCNRFLGAARMGGFDIAFRVNGDSPFTDPFLLDEAARSFAQDGALAFVTNISPRSFPYGVAVEGVRVSRYAESLKETFDLMLREHVTGHIYRNLGNWRWKNIENRDDTGPRDESGVSLTIDTPPHLEEMRAFIEAQSKPWPEITYRDAIRWGGF